MMLQGLMKHNGCYVCRLAERQQACRFWCIGRQDSLQGEATLGNPRMEELLVHAVAAAAGSSRDDVSGPAVAAAAVAGGAGAGFGSSPPARYRH